MNTELKNAVTEGIRGCPDQDPVIVPEKGQAERIRKIARMVRTVPEGAAG